MKSPLLIITLVLFFTRISYGQNIVLSCDTPIEMYNDHVGHEWKFGFGVNRSFVSAFGQVTVPVSSAGTLEFIIQEDDKYPDQTTIDLEIDPALLQVNKLYTRTIEMIVTENAGQFKGNTAKWSITIHYKKTNIKA
jgi:hypothetical protein